MCSAAGGLTLVLAEVQLGDEVLHARAPVPPVLSHPVPVLVTLKQEAVVVWVSCVLAAGSAVAGRQEVDRPRKGASGSSPQHAAPVLHPRHPAPRPLSSSPRRRTGPHNNAYHPPLLQTPPSPTGEVEVEQGGVTPGFTSGLCSGAGWKLWGRGWAAGILAASSYLPVQECLNCVN